MSLKTSTTKVSSWDNFMLYMNWVKCYLDSIYSNMISVVKALACWNYTFYISDVEYTIPILPYIICFIWTVFMMNPGKFIGIRNFYIFKTVIMLYFVIYMLIRFFLESKENNKILKCDNWIVCSVSYVILTEYLVEAMKVITEPSMEIINVK
jgi:multisubunit Na+/H+ antiporter MnhF subunit